MLRELSPLSKTVDFHHKIILWRKTCHPCVPLYSSSNILFPCSLYDLDQIIYSPADISALLTQISTPLFASWIVWKRALIFPFWGWGGWEGWRILLFLYNDGSNSCCSKSPESCNPDHDPLSVTFCFGFPGVISNLDCFVSHPPKLLSFLLILGYSFCPLP